MPIIKAFKSISLFKTGRQKEPKIILFDFVHHCQLKYFLIPNSFSLCVLISKFQSQMSFSTKEIISNSFSFIGLFHSFPFLIIESLSLSLSHLSLFLSMFYFSEMCHSRPLFCLFFVFSKQHNNFYNKLM